MSSASRYYDIDSILAEDERVPSVFNFDALHLGYMTSQAGDVGMDLSGVRRSKRGRYGNDDDDDDDDDEDEAIFQSTVLKRESKVDLPLWLSRGLARRELVTIGTPRSYGARFRVSLLADPRAVDLRSRGAYYFRVGARLAPFFADMPGMEELRLDLAQALISRYQDMIDKAQSSPNEDGELSLLFSTLISSCDRRCLTHRDATLRKQCRR